MTAEQLKQEALNELKQENNSNETINETKLTGEVIAEIISFNDLQAKLSASNKANLQAQASELLQAGKFDEVQTLLNSAKSKTLEIANNLPRYILLTENGVNYLVEAPKIEVKAKGASNQPSNKAKYPDPFQIGDKIQLKYKETIDPAIYTVTSQGLELDGNFYNNKSKVTISGLVERFHVSTLGNKASATGMAGISHSYWTKIQ